MLDKTLGYILCCQSPALFLAALALLVAYLAGRKHKVRAFFRLLLCILCAAGGVALYFLGIYKEYFTIRDFFHIRPAGWVGLVIPHLSRRIVGNNCRWLLPMSMLFGAAFLLLVDNLARCLTAVEIPIGILTAFVGAPFFIYLMVKGGERA